MAILSVSSFPCGSKRVEILIKNVMRIVKGCRKLTGYGGIDL